MQQTIRDDFRLLVECEYPSRAHFLTEFNSVFKNKLSDELLKQHLEQPATISEQYNNLYLVFFDIIKHPRIKQYFFTENKKIKNCFIFETILN